MSYNYIIVCYLNIYKVLMNAKLNRISFRDKNPKYLAMLCLFCVSSVSSSIHVCFCACVCAQQCAPSCTIHVL